MKGKVFGSATLGVGVTVVAGLGVLGIRVGVWNLSVGFLRIGRDTVLFFIFFDLGNREHNWRKHCCNSHATLLWEERERTLQDW